MYLHANPPQGHGEWEDGTQVRLRVMWRTPKEWASYIYAYVGMLRIVFLCAALRLTNAIIFILLGNPASYGWQCVYYL